MTETDIPLPEAEEKDVEKLRSARTPTLGISAFDQQDSRVYEQSQTSKGRHQGKQTTYTTKTFLN